MKNITLLLSLFFLFSCGPEKVKHPAPTANPDAHAGHDHTGHDHTGHDHAGHDHAKGDHSAHNHESDNPNIVTNPDGTVHVKGDPTAFLVGLWEVEYALIGATPKIDDRYKGAWIEMNGDFTFTSGIYDKQTNQGTYKFQSEPNRLLSFTFDKEEKILPAEAKVQGYAVSLVLLGETPMDNKQSQIKIGQTSKKPSRRN